jgi:hypothetical protein
MNSEHVFVEAYLSQLCNTKAKVSVAEPIYPLIKTSDCINQIFAVSDVSSHVMPSFYVLDELSRKSGLVIFGNIYKFAFHAKATVLKRVEAFFDPFLVNCAIGVCAKNVLST